MCIRKPIHAKQVTQYYDHIRTDKDIVKIGWRRSGITKSIKENIRNEDPFENQIILDLYLHGHDFKKKNFDSSLIFVKAYQLIFVKLSLSFANDIFRREFYSDFQLYRTESLKMKSSCSMKQHILTSNIFRPLLICFQS